MRDWEEYDFKINLKHFSKSGLNAVSKALPRRKQ